MNSGNGSGLDSGSAKFGQEVRASEITFNDDSSKFETDRPANKHEEDLQLEVRNFYYHMFTQKMHISSIIQSWAMIYHPHLARIGDVT